jgi:hypothetical protein
VTVTARANQSVTGTSSYIDVFDQTTGQGVVSCSGGSICGGPVTRTAARTHTFIAYVDSDPIFEDPPCCIQATSNTATATWYVRATGAASIKFDANGTLPTFPCAAGGCSATFNGSGTGAGAVNGTAVGETYNAAFAIPDGALSGSANYIEPGPPFCPAIGDATGTVTLTGAATGVVHKTDTPGITGVVTGVDLQLDYAYERVGLTTVMAITGGTAKIYFTFPGTGPGYFVSSVTGAGSGVFNVDASTANAKCQSAGPLPFTVTGASTPALT